MRGYTTGCVARWWRMWTRLGLLAALALPTACTPLRPYRTEAAGGIACSPLDTHANPQTDPGYGGVPPACAHLIEEVAPSAVSAARSYTLHFAEFDDQGELFPATAANGLAAEQTERFLDDVRDAAKAGADARLSVVVFVHGWKHDARSDDSNVRWFRAMLDKLGDVESRSSCPRKVIGLYAGWRGDATSLPDLVKDTTFWTRKKAATRVAEGQIRELLTRLRSIQDIDNATWNGLVESSRRDPAGAKPNEAQLECAKSLRLTIVGHSFGGLIVYKALDQSLIRDIADLHERILDAGNPPIDPVLTREGDLIVTINPAVEASPFVPLWRAARSAQPHSYHSPMFVSVTSADDAATRLAFPAARYLDSLLNKYPDGDRSERASAIETLGQHQDLVDYVLAPLGALNADPAQPPLTADPVCEALRGETDFSKRYDAELGRLHAFESALQAQPDANALAGYFPRQYCINATHNQPGNTEVAMALRPRAGVNLNSPVWNVYTARPVLNDHSDLLNPILIDFLRQLYEEGTSTFTHRVVVPTR